MFTIRTAKTTALAALAAIAMAGLAAAPAFAAGSDDIQPPRAEINVAHVNFGSAAAVEALKHRVARVARDICTTDSASRMTINPEQQACYNAAMQSGLAAIATRQELARRQSTGSTEMAGAALPHARN